MVSHGSLFLEETEDMDWIKRTWFPEHVPKGKKVVFSENPAGVFKTCWFALQGHVWLEPVSFTWHGFQRGSL